MRSTFHCPFLCLPIFSSSQPPIPLPITTNRIGHERRGENGFGYDPLFFPEGREVTMAELTAEQKDAISHRARAAEALVPFLKSYLRP